MQKLAISVVAKVVKPEPAIVDVTVILIDGATALLRLNAFEAERFLGSLPPPWGTNGPPEAIRRLAETRTEHKASRHRTMLGARARDPTLPGSPARLATDRCRRSQQWKEGLRISGFAPVS